MKSALAAAVEALPPGARFGLLSFGSQAGRVGPGTWFTPSGWFEVVTVKHTCRAGTQLHTMFVWWANACSVHRCANCRWACISPVVPAAWSRMSTWRELKAQPQTCMCVADLLLSLCIFCLSKFPLMFEPTAQSSLVTR